MIVALLAILSLFFTNISQIAARAPAYQDRVIEAIQAVAVRFGVETQPTWETIRSEVLGRIDLPRTLGATLASASSIFASFTLALLYAWFVLLERGLFRRKIDRLFDDPERNAEILRVLRTVNSRVGVYLAMKTAVNVLLGAICYVILRVAGIEFAVFWAFLIGVTNYIPYVGSFIGVLFPVALSIVQFGAPGPVLALGAALTAAQITVGNFVEPFVMGNSLNLSPMVIMLSLVVWSALWGLPGSILAVPVTASLMIVLSEFLADTRDRGAPVARGRRGADARPVDGSLTKRNAPIADFARSRSEDATLASADAGPPKALNWTDTAILWFVGLTFALLDLLDHPRGAILGNCDVDPYTHETLNSPFSWELGWWLPELTAHFFVMANVVGLVDRLGARHADLRAVGRLRRDRPPDRPDHLDGRRRLALPDPADKHDPDRGPRARRVGL